MRRWAGAVIAILGVACGDDGPAPVHDSGIDAGVERATVLEFPATPNRDLDLLFVIDDSVAAAEFQPPLIASFPAFIDALSSVPGGLPNLHIGVTTTDMGTTASESPDPAPPVGNVGNGGCGDRGKAGRLVTNGAAVTGAFLSDIEVDGARARNYTGTLPEVFATMASVGGQGCGFEQPLRAMRAALDDNPANTGFLREDALLGIVFLADEDDCSVRDAGMFGPESAALGAVQSFRCTRFGVTCTGGGATSDEMNQPGMKTGCTSNETSLYLDPVAPFRDFLVDLKGGDASRVAVVGLIGDPEPVAVGLVPMPGGGTPVPTLAPSCTFDAPQGEAVANPGVRLKTFLDLFPNRAQSSSICQQDLSGGLALFGELLKTTLGYPCLDPATLADTDPGTPGLQYDCVAEDVLGSTVTEIAPCGPGAPATCWSLVEDAEACPGKLKLAVTRPAPPAGPTLTRLRCVTP